MSIMSIAKHLHVVPDILESTFRLVMHEDLKYWSHVMRKGQYIADQNERIVLSLKALAEQAQATRGPRHYLVLFR